jgi:hypothetical protein
LRGEFNKNYWNVGDSHNSVRTHFRRITVLHSLGLLGVTFRIVFRSAKAKHQQRHHHHDSRTGQQRKQYRVDPTSMRERESSSLFGHGVMGHGENSGRQGRALAGAPAATVANGTSCTSVKVFLDSLASP